MAVAFVQSATAVTSTAATSLACNVPTGTANGNVMVALVVSSTSSTVTPPAGWTRMAGFPVTNTCTLDGFTRVANTEPASYTWNFSASVKICIGVLSYSGVANATPVDKSAASTDTTLATSHTGPSITTTVANDWNLAVYADSSVLAASTWSTPTGLSTRGVNLTQTGATNDGSLAVFDTNAGQATGTYSYASTASQNTNTVAMATIALEPGPVFPPSAPSVSVLQAAGRASIR